MNSFRTHQSGYRARSLSTLCLVILLSCPVSAVPVLFNLLGGATMGVDWVTSNASRAVINSLGELNLRNGYVEVESQVYDFSEADSVDLSFDVSVPFNLLLGFIGAAPNPGENLVAQYRRDDGGWQTLNTFVADNGFLGLLSLGSNYTYSASLPSNAYHDNFQIRYVMTGGGFSLFDLLGDNWYVSDIVINADLPPAGPDHFRFSYLSTALTCNPHSVTVYACADANCTSTYNDDVTIILSPSGWVGGDTRTLSGGSGTFQLRQTTPGTSNIGITFSTPPKIGGGDLCSIDGGGYSANCSLTFASAGFFVSTPDFLSGKGTATATIQAVRQSDNSPLCVPAFSNVTKSVDFYTRYDSPPTGTMVSDLGGVNVSGSAAAPTSLSLNFDGSGTATLPTLGYSDAGQKTLVARYDGSGSDVGLTLVGQDNYVARPAGLCINTGSTCSGSYASCGVFGTAGDSFPVEISAVAWQADSDSDFCDGNTATPNYISVSPVNLSATVLAPSGGENGVISPGSYTHTMSATGITSVSMTQSEVGVFSIDAQPPLYFGAALGTLSDTTLQTFSSRPTGRFIPAYFDVALTDAGSVNSGCPTGNTYTGQPFSWRVAPELTISPYNAATPAAVTQNYTDDDFRKLTAAALFAGVSTPSTDTTAQGKDTTLLPLAGSPDTDFNEGELTVIAPGQMRYVFSALDSMAYARTLNAEVNPFVPDLAFSIGSWSDGEAGFTGPLDFSPDTSGVSIRFGRMRLQDTFGAEMYDLNVGLVTEYFLDGKYVRNDLDDCTDWDSANATVDGISAVAASSGTLSAGSSGDEGIRLLAPTTVPGAPDTGDAGISYTAPTWLRGDYDGDGSFESPSSTVSFGVYRGHERIVYRRELRN
jgi:MSHA biogenesis protein MshQ